MELENGESVKVMTVIEQIKLQELRQEAENRVKRNYETAIAQLEKEIKNEKSQNDHIVEQTKLLQSELDAMQARLALRQIEVDAWRHVKKQWESQLNAETVALDAEHCAVWQRRELFCDAEREFGEQFGVLAMMSGDFTIEETDVFPSKPLEVSKSDTAVLEQSIRDLQIMLESEVSQNRAAAERLTRVTAERERLENEEKEGFEYVRLKNALYYSRERTEKLVAELETLDAPKSKMRQNEGITVVEENIDPSEDSTLQYTVTEIMSQDDVQILKPPTPHVFKKQNQSSKSPVNQNTSKPSDGKYNSHQNTGDVYKYIMETRQNQNARGRGGRKKVFPRYHK